MKVSPMYQDFGTLTPAAPASAAPPPDEQSLKSFEDGYQAGWDDAIKAQADSHTAISAEFAQSLQEMSFTYHEALFKLTRAMQPFMTQLLDRLLPSIAKGALAAHVSEQLAELVQGQIDQPIEIVTSAGNQSALEALIPDGDPGPFALIFDPALGTGQAFVRIGNAERSIDLDGVIEGIETAMAAYFFEMEQEHKHG